MWCDVIFCHVVMQPPRHRSMGTCSQFDNPSHYSTMAAATGAYETQSDDDVVPELKRKLEHTEVVPDDECEEPANENQPYITSGRLMRVKELYMFNHAELGNKITRLLYNRAHDEYFEIGRAHV